MTNTQPKVATSPFVGMSAKQVLELAQAKPELNAEAQTYALTYASKLAAAKGVNHWRVEAWHNTANVLCGGKPAKPVVRAKGKAKAQPKADKAAVLATLQALIAAM